MTDLTKIITQQKVKIVDVRTPMEFSGGSVAGAVNIPLNEIPQRLEEFRQTGSPVIVCCASGMRSSQAESYLRKHGLDNVYDGGSWYDVNYLMNN